MKRKIIIGLMVIGLVIVGAGVVIINQIEANLKPLSTMQITEVDLTKIEDGEYTGKYSAVPVTAEVKVKIEDHQIISISIVSHQNGQGAPAEVIVDHVIAQQSVAVDTIAGATYSSKVILLAIRNALVEVPNK
jgi:uncharacterized protein with FMN-binding domain